MKNGNVRYPLFIRFGLCAVLVAIQVSLHCTNRYGVLCDIIIGICCGIIVVFFACLFAIKIKPYYTCVLLDCIGAFISLLNYWRYVTSWAGNDISDLRKFILFPYAICGVFSWGVWGLIWRKQLNVASTLSVCMAKHKKLLYNTIVIVLYLCTITFLCMAIYFIIGLENSLLAIWALLTSMLAFFSAYGLKNCKLRRK